MKNAVTESEYS